jgi:hypothetical protein
MTAYAHRDFAIPMGVVTREIAAPETGADRKADWWIPSGYEVAGKLERVFDKVSDEGDRVSDAHG